MSHFGKPGGIDGPSPFTSTTMEVLGYHVSASNLQVYAVIALFVAHSCYMVIKKPGAPQKFVCKGDVCRHVPAGTTLAEAGTSSWIPTPLLALLRLGAAVYVIGIGVLQYTRQGNWALKFYTVWSWWLLSVYFFLASVASFAAFAAERTQKQRHRQGKAAQATSVAAAGAAAAAAAAGTVSDDGNGAIVVDPLSQEGKLAGACGALFAAVSTAACVVDAVNWGVLYPMLVLRSPDPAAAQFYRRVLLSFISKNQHIGNLALVVAELGLHRLPFRWHQCGYVQFWSLLYCAWAHGWHAYTGRWLYPFLDTARPWSVLGYLGLLAVHWVSYCMLWAMSRARDAAFATAASPSLQTDAPSEGGEVAVTAEYEGGKAEAKKTQ